MKIAIALLVSSATFAASAAIAADARELFRDSQAFCSQFVIHDPDPRIVRSYMRDCCAYSRNLRDCRMFEWDTIDWDATER